MKNIILSLSVLSLSALIQASELDYPAGSKIPNIKKGEAKVTFLCEDFPTPAKKVDEEVISFYVDQKLDATGLILRSRVNLKDATENDVTLKFRPRSGPVILEKDLYEKLKKRSDEGVIDLKCEVDVSLGPKSVSSCSVTTQSNVLSDDHQLFSQMSSGSSIKPNLQDYPSIKIEAKSWKVAAGELPKISVEKWVIKNKNQKELCLLEVSAKFEVEEEPKSNLSVRLQAEAVKTLDKLIRAFPGKKPAAIQGNKTSRAIEFARLP